MRTLSNRGEDGIVYNHEPPGYRCPFCRNLTTGESDLPLEVVYGDDTLFVKMNPKWRPRNGGAVLVIPNDHYENVYDLPEELGAPIQRAVRSAAIAMKAAFGCDGVSTRQHNEPDGDQDVWHYHVHVFPRWRDDRLDVPAAVSLTQTTSVTEPSCCDGPGQPESESYSFARPAIPVTHEVHARNRPGRAPHLVGRSRFGNARLRAANRA